MWSAFAHWAHYIHMTGYILNVSDFCPLDTLWSLIDWILNVFSMCPLIIGTLAPSEYWTDIPILKPQLPSWIYLIHEFYHFCIGHDVWIFQDFWMRLESQEWTVWVDGDRWPVTSGTVVLTRSVILFGQKSRKNVQWSKENSKTPLPLGHGGVILFKGVMWLGGQAGAGNAGGPKMGYGHVTFPKREIVMAYISKSCDWEKWRGII